MLKARASAISVNHHSIFADTKHCKWMTTTQATMTAITKHETHSYYVIILMLSPVILHCNSSFTLQWKLICIFFASESLWDFFFLIQTESHKNYNHPHQFTQSHVINFFYLDLLLAFLWIHQFPLEFWKCLFIQFSSIVSYQKTVLVRVFSMNFLKMKPFYRNIFAKSSEYTQNCL